MRPDSQTQHRPTSRDVAMTLIATVRAASSSYVTVGQVSRCDFERAKSSRSFDTDVSGTHSCRCLNLAREVRTGKQETALRRLRIRRQLTCLHCRLKQEFGGQGGGEHMQVIRTQ